MEEAHRRILRAALQPAKPEKSFKEFLLQMPEGGDVSIFERRST